MEEFHLCEDKQLVLLDDDELTHFTWGIFAQDKGHNLLRFQSPYALKRILHKIGKKTQMFIDSNLGNKIKGEAVAQELFLLGYENLFMATGEQASDFKNCTWIKDVIGKEYPLAKLAFH